VLLEDGRGAAGRARLAWGARARYRLDWRDDAIGRLDWLGALPTDRQLYGILTYDLALPPRARRATPLVEQPLAEFFEPAQELVLDCATGTLLQGSWTELDGLTGGREPGLPEQPVRPFARPPVLLHRSFTQPAFEAAVGLVKDHIAAGDVYQVNIAVGDAYRTGMTAWELYGRLRALNPSPWMGFADFGDWQVVSGSPELLVEVEVEPEPQVRTRPIAGTRKKTGDPARDAAMRRELSLDDKERAEHRMLVDLARNDVGRVAAYGSVRVSEREVIEEYSHVFHLVSEVVGHLAPERTVADALAALFPGGTITGAPKIRAMEVIAELEPVARGVYTGGLGWMGPGGAQFNILIRSAARRDGVTVLHAGAGIVWDSDPAREWRESLRKAAALRVALGAES